MVGDAVAGSVTDKERRRDRYKRRASRFFDRLGLPAGDVSTPATTVAPTAPQHLVVPTTGVLAGIQMPASAPVSLIVPGQMSVPATGTPAVGTSLPGNQTTGTPSTPATVTGHLTHPGANSTSSG